MILTYNNDLGTLKFYGSGEHLLNICEIEGLEPPAKQRRTQCYIGEDGCVESSSQYGQRIITLSGDTKENGILKNAARILSYGGTLVIQTDNSARKITVNEATLSVGKRYGAYTAFVIQFICDYPHFSAVNSIESAVFKRVNKLSSESKLPLILSERVANGQIDNLGDIKIYPVISIRKLSDKAGSNTITITNTTTGKKLVFNKAMELGEQIVIDIKERTVTSSVDGNVLSSLDRFCSLSDMWCDLGVNDIGADIDGSERGIEVYITYFNEYTEAL